MEIVLRKILIILFTIFIVSCSQIKSEKFNEITSLYFERNNDNKIKTFTRNEFDDFNYPIIEIRTNHILRQVLFLTISERNGYRNYISGIGQSLTTQGALITKTNGFDAYLISLEADKTSPLIKKTVPSKWPNEGRKKYSFILPDYSIFTILFNCKFSLIKKTEISIVEKEFLVHEFQETCNSNNYNFTNYYWVDKFGFIWKSKQWVSLRNQEVELIVIKE